MKSLYKKYNGMLMTLPEDATDELIAEYKNSGRKPMLLKYDEEAFLRLVNEAKKYTFREIRYVDGQIKSDDYYCAFTPKTMVILRGELFAVRFNSPCAVGSAHYVIPLKDMAKEPCLAETHVDRYDDYGDHDSWTVKNYIEMIIKE